MATVSHGRPIGSRSIGSTTIRSMGVWSTCTRSSGCLPCGAWPCTGFASGCSSPRRRMSAMDNALRRRRTVLGDGGRSFSAPHRPSHLAHKPRGCWFLWREIELMHGLLQHDLAGVATRGLARPPLDLPGRRAVKSPPASLQRRTSVYVCRSDKPSCRRCGQNQMAWPPFKFCARGRITAARRSASRQSASGMTDRSAIFALQSATHCRSTLTKCRLLQRTVTIIAEDCDRVNRYISTAATAVDFGK